MDTPLPAVILKWDEASATQAVYLYSQIALHYSGDARAFFDVMRHPGNRVDGAAPEAFRLATLDIGAGTTDLVISSFRVEGQGAIAGAAGARASTSSITWAAMRLGSCLRSRSRCCS